jgi:hypothetical protein
MWFLAIPHYVVLVFLYIGVLLVDRGVVRDPLHRPLPARALLLRRGRDPLAQPRRRLRLHPGHRPLPTVPAAPLTRRSSVSGGRLGAAIAASRQRAAVSRQWLYKRPDCTARSSACAPVMRPSGRARSRERSRGGPLDLVQGGLGGNSAARALLHECGRRLGPPSLVASLTAYVPTPAMARRLVAPGVVLAYGAERVPRIGRASGEDLDPRAGSRSGTRPVKGFLGRVARAAARARVERRLSFQSEIARLAALACGRLK